MWCSTVTGACLVGVTAHIWHCCTSALNAGNRSAFPTLDYGSKSKSEWGKENPTLTRWGISWSEKQHPATAGEHFEVLVHVMVNLVLLKLNRSGLIWMGVGVSYWWTPQVCVRIGHLWWDITSVSLHLSPVLPSWPTQRLWFYEVKKIIFASTQKREFTV